MSLLLETAALNNVGVASFHEGDFESALHHFRRGLQVTVGGLHESNVDEPRKDVPNERCSSPVRHSPITANMISSCAYTRAFNPSPTEAAYALDPLVNVTIVSSIVLFNLALVYHVKGMEDFDICSQACLLKARSLYFKAKALLVEAGVSLRQSTRHPVIDVLTMALFNNCAQVAHSLSEYDECRSEVGRLVAFADTLRLDDHCRQEPETLSLLEWHKSLILGNALYFQPPNLASAA